MEDLLTITMIEAKVTGDGPPLVLLHSLLADQTSFSRVVGPLSRRFRVMLPARLRPIAGLPSPR